MIHVIGNLTLVNGRLNPALSNAPQKEKKKALTQHNVLFLSKHLMNDGPRVWNETAVEERANQLHKTAVKVWPHRVAIKAA